MSGTRFLLDTNAITALLQGNQVLERQFRYLLFVTGFGRKSLQSLLSDDYLRAGRKMMIR
ncbi:hypothetical protein DR864_09610 [Runella rosea]|uniref:Uncharacterized protein n=1 Tax=Runella rosea TaxID=2259595 RepID=A0A344TH50_9BACT|nr:hypothetical protein DR864_09610 [Runella rosea]